MRGGKTLSDDDRLAVLDSAARAPTSHTVDRVMFASGDFFVAMQFEPLAELDDSAGNTESSLDDLDDFPLFHQGGLHVYPFNSCNICVHDQKKIETKF
jgi:hypothetical protein